MNATNTPSIKMTVIGLGQAGNRIANVFAKVEYKDRTPVYNCLAINSNTADLKDLEYIKDANKLDLMLGGLGKNPEKAIQILEENSKVNELIHDFIQNKIRDDDDLVLFTAGLGGGTGTAAIIKCLREFAKIHNTPVIQEELTKIVKSIGEQEYVKDKKKYVRLAVKQAKENPKFKKIGIVVTLPVRSDGPDTLRQVNHFAQEIWKMTKTANLGISFTIFADNQLFSDQFRALKTSNFDNYRDYANEQIFRIINDLNFATNRGGSSVVMDSADFRRIVHEGMGCLVLNKVSRNVEGVVSGAVIENMILESMKGSFLHDPIQLENEDGSQAKIHHVGVLAILDNKADQISTSFLDDARDKIFKNFFLEGTIFTGYLIEKGNYNVTVYTLFKADALPTRLSTGLVEEYQQYQAKKKEVTYKEVEIARIEAAAADDFDDDVAIDLDFLGIEDEIEETKPEEIQESNLNLLDDINLDYDDIKDGDL